MARCWYHSVCSAPAFTVGITDRLSLPLMLLLLSRHEVTAICWVWARSSPGPKPLGDERQRARPLCSGGSSEHVRDEGGGLCTRACILPVGAVENGESPAGGVRMGTELGASFVSGGIFSTSSLMLVALQVGFGAIVAPERSRASSLKVCDDAVSKIPPCV
jgi:hypothetical protein